MDIVFLPSMLAICIKVGIFARYHESLRRENLNLGLLFLSLLMLNLIELLTINPTQFSQTAMMTFLLAYYCCAIFVVHSFITVALQYSQFKWQPKALKIILNLLMATTILAVIFSRRVIADVEVIFQVYSITRVAGDAYWVFQLYTVAGLLFATSVLVIGSMRLAGNIGRQRCLMVLISTSIPVLTAFVVMSLMALDVQINAAFFLPLALSVMLALMVYAEEKSRLFRLLTFVPYTKERSFHRNVLAAIDDCIGINDDPRSQRPLNLKLMMKNLEGMVVEHVLGYYEGNQKKAAGALGVSEATVSRRTRNGQ